jgi:enamine deaminase RidA (YjgF/YER057c/UK114 family)
VADKQIANFGHFAEQPDVYGFSQAVKVGDTIYVSGQTGSDPESDMETQMREAYAGIAKALGQLGATMDDVVDETLYVADMNAAIACAAKVRGEAYGGRFELASSLIGIDRLGGPGLEIEIKCTARV